MENNTTSEEYEYDNYYDEQAELAYEDMRFILLYSNIPLCIFGVPSNVLIITLILRMKYLGMASGLIIYLAIMDSLTLTANVIQRQLFYNRVLITDWGCKFYFSTGLSFTAIANWTLVLISFERFLTMCYPFQRQSLINNKVIKIGVVIGSLSLVVFVFLFQGIFSKMEDEECQHDLVQGNALEVTEAAVIYAVPFLFIAAFTVAVIRKIRVTSRRRSSVTSFAMTSARRKSSLRDARQSVSSTSIQGMERSLVQLMLSAAFLYFALHIVYFVERFILLQVYGENRSRGLHVLDYVSRIIRDLNHALNLYVYLAFSKGFRSNLIKMLLPCPVLGKLLGQISEGGRSRSSSTAGQSETKSDQCES